MATSGSVDFSISRSDIIEDALKKCRAYRVGQAVSGAQTASASRALNVMVKSWVTQGLHVWRQQEAILFLVKDQQSYTLSSSGDRVTHTYVDTNLDGALSVSATAVTIDSTTGMTAADNIGIELSDGTIHWDTISSVDSSTTLTLTTGVSGAADDDAQVYSYTSLINRPLDIVEARRVVDDNEVDIDIVSRDEYFELPQKDSTGAPNLIYYQPELNQGKLYVWPASDNNVDLIKMTVMVPFEDFDASNDEPYFPIEWGKALIYGLAADLGDDYGLPMDRLNRIEAKARNSLNDVLRFDQENESIYFEPDWMR